MNRTYKCLPQQEFTNGNYKLIPIRDEDKYSIMQWRNEQIDILRQKEPLTKEDQESYFRNVVDKLFEDKKPNQLLFSFLENDILIGYGGLVHIDWESRNGEISFLTAPERNKSKNTFYSDWGIYLKIIKRIAELQLDFIKIYTYSYDIRPQVYHILNEHHFIEEARLKNHVLIKNKFQYVLINSFFFEDIRFRLATEADTELYFKWANDKEVRSNSFTNDLILFEDHSKWFKSQLTSDKCFFYLFLNAHNVPVGQVRIENQGNETIISISVDEAFRGKSLSPKMLLKSTNDYLSKQSDEKIIAYIKYENISSYKSFISAGFFQEEILNKEGIKSYKLFRKNHA